MSQAGSSLEIELEKIKTAGYYRTLALPEGIDFSSNDYLGLSQDRRLSEKLIQALKEGVPIASTGSRLISGHSPWHQQAEEELAVFFGTPKVCLFSSGYLANLGVIAALDSADTHFFSDEKIHASMIDALRLARGKKDIFQHLNLNCLEEKLKHSSASTKVILVESLFSMDGDCAPLEELLRLSEKFEAFLIIDEAHATGVLGPAGRGLTPQKQRHERTLTIHTGGKALASPGAFVTGSSFVTNLITNRARSFIFSTALSPLAVVQLHQSLLLATHLDDSRKRLQDHISYFREHTNLEILGDKNSPIIPIGEDALRRSEKLKDLGYFVKLIRYPTVPRGSERLRLTLRANHTLGQIQDLLRALS